jgi:hypothetical protein
LAYLDGILEPNDAQDLGKKIEDSEFATNLVHRIRDVMRRARLAAPDAADHSARLDPNTVAEYLDNTLDAEGVTEFEKTCLDSDLALSEVSSCHQILTLVLGEPAEIDPATRQRMYQVPEPGITLAPPVVSAPESPLVTTSVVLPPSLDLGPGDGERRQPRPRPTVPEYLREPRKSRHWFPAVAGLVVAVSMLVVVLNLFGQLEPGTPLGNMLVRWGVVQAPPELAAQSEGRVKAGGEEKPSTKLPAIVTPGPPPKPAKPPAAEPTAAKSAEKESPKAAAETTVLPLAKAAAVTPPAAPARESPAEPVKTTVQMPPGTTGFKPESVPPRPGIPAPGSVAAVPAGEAGKTAGAKLAAVGEAASGAATKPVAPLPPALASNIPPMTGTPAAAKAAATSPQHLGQFLSADQLLLKYDAAVGGWLRLTANQELVPERLLALPTYRPHVALAAGVAAEILGGTDLELLPADPAGLPGIGIRYGRVVMMPLEKPSARLRVLFGDRGGVLTFADVGSVAALLVRRIHRPGANPEAGPFRVVADLYASAGGLTWEEGEATGAKGLRLAAPQWVTFNGTLTSTPATSNDLPAWITAEEVGMLDRRASPALARELPTDRLARVGLLELSASRPQKEVKWLALRCLGYVGQFRDMVAALNDPARWLEWPEYVEQLREAVARDAESAAAVRRALEQQYPQQAAALYRMLWGYSNKDLEDGADKALVDALESDTLAVRVLGFRTLHDLTGVGLYYQPQQTAAKRVQPTVAWQKRLKKGEIRLKTPEEKAGAAAEEKTAPNPAGSEK